MPNSLDSVLLNALLVETQIPYIESGVRERKNLAKQLSFEYQQIFFFSLSLYVQEGFLFQKTIFRNSIESWSFRSPSPGSGQFSFYFFLSLSFIPYYRCGWIFFPRFFIIKNLSFHPNRLMNLVIFLIIFLIFSFGVLWRSFWLF